MEGQNEKSRHAAVGPDEWDGPSESNLYVSVLKAIGQSYRLNYCSHVNQVTEGRREATVKWFL